jgi:hypothetical protein
MPSRGSDRSDFDWRLFPEAEEYLLGLVRGFLSRHSYAANLADRIERETSTRFLDWIDHIVIRESEADIKALEKLGFDLGPDRETPDGMHSFRRYGSTLFPILLTQKAMTQLAIKVERVEDFRERILPKAPIQGEPMSPLRIMEVSRKYDHHLIAVERRGTPEFVLRIPNDLVQYKAALENFSKRRRAFDSDEEGIKATEELVERTVSSLNPSRAADAFFRAERIYWEGRNTAGHIQKIRQEALGLGWANHDHHAFRCSRENFKHVVSILELLGMRKRERFYAGKQAGWGAQVLEQGDCNIVVFADVDMGETETSGDFGEVGLLPREELGTIGLWVGLHGESLLQAGLHHIASRFSFDGVTRELAAQDVGMMAPFSDFEFLKQAFTTAEMWQVDEARAKELMLGGVIDLDGFDGFVKKGAIGSHLENIERAQGFKGFNQDSVNVIITATDPRIQTQTEPGA